MSTARTSLWVDCDPGVDDALALLYLAGHADADVVAVSTVHGNVTAGLGAHNALRTWDVAGVAHVPVLVGVDHPLVYPTPTAEEVHGQDGLGDAGLGPAVGRPSPGCGPLRLIEWARAHPGQLCLLALGPLTNVAVALRLEPRLPTLIPRLVIMGGAVFSPGNTTAAAEFNIAHDPEAAQIVLSTPWDITLVGLDVTRRALLAGSHLEHLQAARDPRARFACAILERYMARYERRTGIRGAPLHDPLAAAIALHPTLALYQHRVVAVELNGTATRGATVPLDAAEGRATVKVAVDLEADRFLSEFVGRLGAAR